MTNNNELEEVVNLLRCFHLAPLGRYICRISDPFTRQIFIERIINCKTWTAVAVAVGGDNTPDSVRMAFRRYLKRHPIRSEK